ncbi:response regulator [Rhodalgimonas zhirmunskyi]|uniref:Response regulator n=1 Tax=Rhodalgimonas zhirmunskyi TaxID=2964767 RepID=A0AAJ1UGF5_9RHOB|nr:response regulator [Rhodoalgimonas zhirmunskyi]MDQ2095712.1 response regulator [Rhodoalgimonas zhirmunskyi]
MRRKVFAVDDSRTMRAMLEATLHAAGFDVALAEDGQDGLDRIDRVAPDLVITDLNMPRLDGFGFIEGVRARERHRGLPILVLTTESGAALKMRAREVGATGWIVKPFDDAKLVAAINRLVA